MTKVTFFKNEDKIYRFVAKDHAGYADKGYDIVCASISILIINTINSIDELNHEEINLKQDEHSGLIDFELLTNKESSTQVLLKSLELGLRSIQEEYGSDYLKVQTKEVNDNVKA